MRTYSDLFFQCCHPLRSQHCDLKLFRSERLLDQEMRFLQQRTMLL